MQERAKADFARIVSDLDRFGVAGIAARRQIIGRGFSAPAGIARNGTPHATNPLKNTLHTPEAATRENCHSGLASVLDIPRRRWNHHRGLLGDAVPTK